MHLLYKLLGGQWKYTTQPKGSFWCHVVATKGAVLLLIFTNELELANIIPISFYIFFYLSFSFRYLLEFKLLQNFKNVTWA